jgi:hypothetical protein
VTFLSVFRKDRDILDAFSNIYLNGDWFDLDPTYSKGTIYKSTKKDVKLPKYKTDLNPVTIDSFKMDCRKLNFKNSSLRSIIFDPPFLLHNDFMKSNGAPKAKNNDKMCKRFSYFQNFEELIQMYIDSVTEFERVLENRGFLFFKCQDFTDGSGTRNFFDTHCKIISIARAVGFSLQDIAILFRPNKFIKKGRQGCLRKAHCYYLVFRKESKDLEYMKTLKHCDEIITKRLNKHNFVLPKLKRKKLTLIRKKI